MKKKNDFYVDKFYHLNEHEQKELQNIGQPIKGQLFNPNYLSYLADKFVVNPENRGKAPKLVSVDMNNRLNPVNKPSFSFDAPKLNSEITIMIPRRKTGKSPNVPSGFFEQSKLDDKRKIAASNIQRLYKGFKLRKNLNESWMIHQYDKHLNKRKKGIGIIGRHTLNLNKIPKAMQRNIRSKHRTVNKNRRLKKYNKLKMPTTKFISKKIRKLLKAKKSTARIIPDIVNQVQKVKKVRKAAVRLICSKAGIKKYAWSEFMIPRVAKDVVNKIAKDEQNVIREELVKGRNAMPWKRQTLLARDIWPSLFKKKERAKRKRKKKIC